MRLHKFQERIDADKGFPNPDPSLMLPREVLNFEGAVQFDFGDVTSVSGDEWKGLQDYAIELIEFGLFRMPFDRCYYTYKADETDFSASIVSKGDRIYCLFASGKHGLPDAIIAYAIMWNCPHDMPGRFKIIHQSAAHPNSNAFYCKEIERHNLFVDCVTVAVRNMCALTCMLSAGGVEQVITPQPVKLNKHRAKRGLPIIQEVREIIIRKNKKVYLSSGQESGSHKSPRLHWRRGHLRRLPSGVITNVRPCLVGDVGEASNPSYVVRAA